MRSRVSQTAKLGFRRTSNPGLSTPACPVFQSYAVTATPETEAMGKTYGYGGLHGSSMAHPACPALPLLTPRPWMRAHSKRSFGVWATFKQ